MFGRQEIPGFVPPGAALVLMDQGQAVQLMHIQQQFFERMAAQPPQESVLTILFMFTRDEWQAILSTLHDARERGSLPPVLDAALAQFDQMDTDMILHRREPNDPLLS
jgi:hypothetical protein